MRRALYRLGLGALTLSACAGTDIPSKPALHPMPETLRGRTVFIGDPAIDWDQDKVTNQCPTWAQNLARQIVEGARNKLNDEGLAVVVDRTAPHALEARLSVHVNFCGMYGPIRGTAEMVLTTKGRLVDRLRSSVGSAGGPGDFDALADAMSSELVVAAAGSHALTQALAEAPASERVATATPSTASPSSSTSSGARASNATAAAASLPASPFVAAAPQPSAYAFVVGIERYRDVPAATGARGDAERFAQLVHTTLGLTEAHVRVALEDHATKTDVLEGLDWLKSSASPGSRVYFFFSGHGAPSVDASTYLLPYDGDPKNVAASALAMSDVMSALGATHAHDVLAIVDACFSGAGGRSVLPPGARALMRVREAVPTAQIALFTASQGDEISGPAPGENGGVFTKYVTDGLGTGAADANGDGQISLAELSAWVSPRVVRDSKRENREQHPRLVTGSGVADPSQFIVGYGFATK